MSSQYVRRPKGFRYTQKYVLQFDNRSKASVNTWAVFGVRGYSPLVRIHGINTALGYITILQDNLLPIYATLLPHGGQFVQDNCPLHTAKVTTTWLTDHKIAVMAHPPISPDMNCIETVWADLGKTMERHKSEITNRNNLFHVLSREWNNLMSSETYRINKIRSMPERVSDLMKCKGSYTKW